MPLTIKDLAAWVGRPKNVSREMRAIRSREVVVTDYPRGAGYTDVTTVVLVSLHVDTMNAAAFWGIGQPCDLGLFGMTYFTTREKALLFMADLLVGTNDHVIEHAQRNSRDVIQTWTAQGVQFPEYLKYEI